MQTMFLTPAIDDEGTTKLYLLSAAHHERCKKLLTKYKLGQIDDWPDEVDEILGTAIILEPGSDIPACRMSTGTISTSGDGGGWYEGDD